jgi:hypothetical protein
MLDEPEVVAPESVFQSAVIEEVKEILNKANQRFFLIEGFGLDIALFISRRTETAIKFLEVKVFNAGRPGGVGLGTPKGQGPQVELLLKSSLELATLDSLVQWIYADATKPKGSARYALFSSVAAQAAVMRSVEKGKQNNLRISSLKESLVSWPQLFALLSEFLLS